MFFVVPLNEPRISVHFFRKPILVLAIIYLIKSAGHIRGSGCRRQIAVIKMIPEYNLGITY